MAARAKARPAAGHRSLALDLPTLTADHASVDQQRRGREPSPLDPRRILTEADLETALASLPGLSTEAVRAAYRKLYRRSPPAAFSRDLLIRAVAYELQEQVRGGLTPETKLLLDRLARGKAQAARWIKPGSTIVRSWGGQTHQVVVTARGLPVERLGSCQPVRDCPPDHRHALERAPLLRPAPQPSPRGQGSRERRGGVGHSG